MFIRPSREQTHRWCSHCKKSSSFNSSAKIWEMKCETEEILCLGISNRAWNCPKSICWKIMFRRNILVQDETWQNSLQLRSFLMNESELFLYMDRVLVNFGCNPECEYKQRSMFCCKTLLIDWLKACEGMKTCFIFIGDFWFIDLFIMGGGTYMVMKMS